MGRGTEVAAAVAAGQATVVVGLGKVAAAPVTVVAVAILPSRLTAEAAAAGL